MASYSDLSSMDIVEERAGLVPFFKGNISVNYSSSFLTATLHAALPKFCFVVWQGSSCKLHENDQCNKA